MNFVLFLPEGENEVGVKKVRLPDNPNERILVKAVEPEVEILNRSVPKDGFFLLSLGVDEVEVENARFPGRLAVGRVFALSPYSNDLYVDANDDLTLFALKRKGQILSRVAQELGATRVKFEGLRDVNTSVEYDVGVSASLMDEISVGAGGAKQAIQKMRNALRMDLRFSAGPVNTDGALAVMHENLQDRDEDLLTLVEHREAAGNELKKLEVALAVRNEMKDILEIGFKVPMDVLDFGIDFKKQQESTDRYAIKYTIEF